MTGGRPPAILVLRQLAHLRTLLRSMIAMAIAHRRLGRRNRDRGLISQGGSGSSSYENCNSNGLANLNEHGSFCSGKAAAPIARRMGSLGIGVVAVLGLGFGLDWKELRT